MPSVTSIFTNLRQSFPTTATTTTTRPVPPSGLNETLLKENVLERLKAIEATQFGLLRGQKEIIETQKLMMERLAMLEQTCRSLAASVTKKHDDPDDEAGPHEGEIGGQQGDTSKELHEQTAEAEVEEHVERGEQTGVEASTTKVTFDIGSYEDEFLKMLDQEQELEASDSEIDSVKVKSVREELIAGEEVLYYDFPMPAWCYPDYIPEPAAEVIEPVQEKVPTPEPVVVVPEGFLNWDVSQRQRTKKVVGFEEDLSKEMIVQTSKKFGRFQFSLPYLEEYNAHLFIKKVKKLNVWKLWNLDDWGKEERKRYKFVMKTKAQSAKNVYSRSKIVFIVKISHFELMKVKVPTFHVIRSNGNQSHFTEADFPKMDFADIDYLITELKGWEVKPAEVQDAEKALVRYMKFRINFTNTHDLQMGLEAGQPCINLEPPTKKYDGLEQFRYTYYVTEKPARGVIYPKENGEQSFVWVNDISKYSDQTIQIICANLRSTLVVVNRSPSQDKDQKWFDWKKSIEDMLAELQRLIRSREIVRDFERFFGLREKKNTR